MGDSLSYLDNLLLQTVKINNLRLNNEESVAGTS